MALLDVSEVLDDPLFSDEMLCIRRVQTVGANGLATDLERKISFSGVVTNPSGDKLQRREAGQLVSGNINITTRFKLQEATARTDADIVVWQCQRYTVTQVNDWSNFGSGFIAAQCDLIPFSE